MTCGAILRRVILAVAGQASPHRVFYQTLRRSGLLHIAMTLRALDAGPDMRRVLKLHQRAGIEAVNALPRNLVPRGGILGDFLDFWIVGSDLSVAQHALRHRWNGRARAGIGPAVTIEAPQSVIDMYFMRIRDGLLGMQHRSGERQNHRHEVPCGKATDA